MEERLERVTGSKIFLVDDSKVALGFMTPALKGFGFETISFTDPIEAYETIESEMPDCILTDFEMPGINGCELIKKIKTNDKIKHIPIIVLTSVDADTNIVSCLSAGASDYLLKNSNPEIILAKLLLVLESKKYRDQALKDAQMKAFEGTVVTLNHELNNIIQIITLSLPIIQEIDGLQEREQKYIENVGNSCSRLTDLLKKLKEVDNLKFMDYLKDSTQMVDIGTDK